MPEHVTVVGAGAGPSSTALPLPTCSMRLQGIAGRARSTFALEAVADVLGVKHEVFGELAAALP